MLVLLREPFHFDLINTILEYRGYESIYRSMGRKLTQNRDARELVAELEFVWDQIKNNSASSSGSSPGRRVPEYASQSQPRQFQQPRPGTDGPMRVLAPMSQDDEEERNSVQLDAYDDDHSYNEADKKDKKTRKWRRTIEQAIVKMTAEIAALREQIATGREYQGRKQRSMGNWIAWFLWLCLRHAVVDGVVLGLILLYLRRRKDRRIEDLVRAGLKIGREYVRMIVPAR
jgi:hypothetical protein